MADSPSARTGPRKRRAGVGRWIRRVLVAVATLVLCIAAAVGVLWPLTPGVSDAAKRVRIELAAHHDPMLTALPRPDRVGIAVIATENSRFYADPGIDPLGVLRAARNTLTGSNLGAATLEQQLAKRLYTPTGGGLAATVEDTEVAVKLDAHYSKTNILRLYLADVYFGDGAYGLPAATRRYFGLDLAHLSWAQAALVAGLPQAPSAYDPLHHMAAARTRQRHVLNRLAATGVLTPQQANAAYAAPLHLRTPTANGHRG